MLHMACLEGLEPPTYCLEGSCSIQLSYRHISDVQPASLCVGKTDSSAAQRRALMERVKGIEPSRPAWKAGILPLNYTRILYFTNRRSYIVAYFL